LNQLHLSADLDVKSIHKVDLLTSHLAEQSPLNNSATEKIFARFKARVRQQFEGPLKAVDPVAYAGDEDVVKVYECIAVDPPKGNRTQASKNQSLEAEDKEEDPAEPDKCAYSFDPFSCV
jgi:condensin complex subunit 3